MSQRFQRGALWAGLVAAIGVPLAFAAASPLLAWRQPIYIAAGFAGVIGLALLLVQPLLATGRLPGFEGLRGRHLHRWVGLGLVVAIAVHVLGLWVTSPPDVIDALLFRSPTPFAAWGVIAMWGVLAAALVALVRRRLLVSPRLWRRLHTSLAIIVAVGSVVHAVLIQGTMEFYSKAALSALVLGATLWALWRLRIWR